MEIWTFWTWWMKSYSDYVKCPIVVETKKFNVLQNGCMWSALVAVDTESTPNGELSVGEARRTFLKNQTCFKIREKEKGKNRVDFCSKRLLLTSFGGQQMCLIYWRKRGEEGHSSLITPTQRRRPSFTVRLKNANWSRTDRQTDRQKTGGIRSWQWEG